MNTPTAPDFVFLTPSFDWDSGVLSLSYAFDGGTRFEERIVFANPPALNSARRDAFLAACTLIHRLAGVSYYKAYCPKVIRFEGAGIDTDTATFLQDVYTQGLGEFAFENDLDIRARVHFTGQGDYTPAPALGLANRALVPVGGGKDSVVSIEALKAAGHDITLFAVGGAKGAATPIADCIAVSGLPHIYISRTLDAELKVLNDAGAYNGHIPITAIISAIAVASAILYDFNAVILSNEYSASAPNLVQDGFDVNHQYSKSLAFERDFAGYVRRHIARDVDYFSLLRPLSEVAIAKRFATHGAYHAVFRSCNTAFRQDATKRGTHWCCDCPKCRFVFLALAPFMPKAELVNVFGANMLADDTQILGFKQLCGLADFKPFECVGEVEESATLMQALSRMDEWKDDVVVQACAIDTPDFDTRFAALLAPHKDVILPARFAHVLDERFTVILGTGREGRAIAQFIAPAPFVYADDAAGDDSLDGVPVMRGAHVADALARADIVIKSPGVSLYDTRLVGKAVTSLANLWFAQNTHAKTICITATKGKSTTSTLLHHVLQACGINAHLCGNIGVPLNRDALNADVVIIEMSSYQTADFNGVCDIGMVLNLYEDHFDWHGGRAQYHVDKLNILRHAKRGFIGEQAAQVAEDTLGATVIKPAKTLPDNAYLSRVHNAHNVAAVLAVTQELGLHEADVLAAMKDFRGLAHRQFELGVRDDVLYVDDSIATTPASTLAALDVYAGRPVTLIAGGYDRGIDYAPLVAGISNHDVRGVVCLGDSGARIYALLQQAGFAPAAMAADMDEAVAKAQAFAPENSVILLSPAAPSFGLFKNYEARGEAFAKAAKICKDSAP